MKLSSLGKPKLSYSLTLQILTIRSAVSSSPLLPVPMAKAVISGEIHTPTTLSISSTGPNEVTKQLVAIEEANSEYSAPVSAASPALTSNVEDKDTSKMTTEEGYDKPSTGYDEHEADTIDDTAERFDRSSAEHDDDEHSMNDDYDWKKA